MRAGQRKWVSLAESLLNVAIGYGVAVLTQIVVFPWFGIEVDLSTNLGIGAVFTVVSILRSYWVRRFFNWLHVKEIEWGL